MNHALILQALALLFAVELVRTFPWPEAWKQKKPLSCSVCMAGWAAIVVWVGDSRSLAHDALLFHLALAGVTLLLLLLAQWLRGWAPPGP